MGRQPAGEIQPIERARRVSRDERDGAVVQEGEQPRDSWGIPLGHLPVRPSRLARPNTQSAPVSLNVSISALAQLGSARTSSSVHRITSPVASAMARLRAKESPIVSSRFTRGQPSGRFPDNRLGVIGRLIVDHAELPADV